MGASRYPACGRRPGGDHGVPLLRCPRTSDTTSRFAGSVPPASAGGNPSIGDSGIVSGTGPTLVIPQMEKPSRTTSSDVVRLHGLEYMDDRPVVRVRPGSAQRPGRLRGRCRRRGGVGPSWAVVHDASVADGETVGTTANRHRWRLDTIVGVGLAATCNWSVMGLVSQAI